MVRVQTKGGIWKNTEDEILKAAVMKYGKNQWSRISSLLTRKTAKQCKQRWYEWLDPMIKKTDWGREEDEKLLHAAKIMPNQWKTIAPIVGRTAAQCLERYEKLLDAAQNKEIMEGADDPRRLRPGEIDPSPETKPARPDPVDMDEDEKEMLSEARARLANTKGKKAKRKAREKQLEEARRLASLQKRRELAAAGMPTRRFQKKVKKGIDYANEIPYLIQPPSGFYETNFAEEYAQLKEKQNNSSFRKINLDTLEGHSSQKSSGQGSSSSSDKNKKKPKLDKTTLSSLFEKISQESDLNFRRNAKLSLSSPNLNEAQLKELAKNEKNFDMGHVISEEMLNEENSNSITKSLLGDYSKTPLRTPLFNNNNAATNNNNSLRTPQREDFLKKEAANLIALTNSSTPLLGGQNPEIHPTDFTGITPRRNEIRTPNVLATPLREQQKNQKIVGSTPIRDFLKINSSQELIEEEMNETRKRKNYQLELRKALDSLPSAQNEYDVAIPEENEENFSEISSEILEEDMSEKLAKEQKKKEENEKKKWLKRSFVLQKNLPRPHSVFHFSLFCLQKRQEIFSQILSFLNNSAASLNEFFIQKEENEKTAELKKKIVEQEIREEMLEILVYESKEYPFQSSHKYLQELKQISQQQKAAFAEDSKLLKALLEKNQNNKNFSLHHQNHSFSLFRPLSDIFAAFIQDEKGELYPEVDEKNLQEARSLVEKEMNESFPQAKELFANKKDEFAQAWNECEEETSFNKKIPHAESNPKFQKFSLLSKKDKAEVLEKEFLSLQKLLQVEDEKTKKLENKVNILLKGYNIRANQLSANIQGLFQEYLKATTDKECYQRLLDQEAIEIPLRIEKLKEEVGEFEKKERNFQLHYQQLLEEKEAILAANK